MRSPWVYEELMFTKHIRSRSWEKHRKRQRVDGAVTELFQKSMVNIAYKLPNKHLKQLTFDDLIEWINRYGNEDYGGNGT